MSRELSRWILILFFEAFDESWKGSSDPDEPEKILGLFHVDRTPVMAVEDLQ